MTDNDIRKLIEAGELKIDPEPVEFDVDLRGERLTIRFTIDEINSIEHVAKRRGVGRSTLIRMFVLQGLQSVDEGNRSVTSSVRIYSASSALKGIPRYVYVSETGNRGKYLTRANSLRNAIRARNRKHNDQKVAWKKSFRTK